MSMDFNDAESQRGEYDLIPDNTVVALVTKVRPGEAGDGGWLKRSQTGCNMLDLEFVIDGGPYDRRKVWGFWVVEGETEGHQKAAKISRARLRAALESAHNVKPGDDGKDAVAKRQVKSWGDFDGLRFAARIGIEKSKDPQYGDKNVVRSVVTPDDEDYAAVMAGSPSSAKPAQGASPSSAKKPAWAS